MDTIYEMDDFSDLWSVHSFDSPMSDIDLPDAGGDNSQDCWDSLLTSAANQHQADHQSPAVILNDRMMTEAAVGCPRSIAMSRSAAAAHVVPSLINVPTLSGGVPSTFSSDHSYSLANGNDRINDNDDSHSDHIKLEPFDKDLDSECLLAVPMNSINHNDNMVPENMHIKSEPPSPPGSPCSGSSDASSDFESFDSSESLLSTSLHHQSSNAMPSSHHPQSLLKQPTIVLATRQNSQQNQSQSNRRMVFPKVNIKVEAQTPGFLLPPTPPSSSNGSDSESSGSPSPSHTSSCSSSLSSKHHSSSQRVMSSSNASSMKGLNNSPLISSQPKGATGMLYLTEEEKRTLIAEGYPIPQRLPLTKAEEKSLKKVRRKIKNKISAQESRRKKKEYMDMLEKKVEILQNETSEYKRRVDSLESSNKSLLSQLRELQMLVGEVPSKTARISTSSNSVMQSKRHVSTSKSTNKL